MNPRQPNATPNMEVDYNYIQPVCTHIVHIEMRRFYIKPRNCEFPQAKRDTNLDMQMLQIPTAFATRFQRCGAPVVVIAFVAIPLLSAMASNGTDAVVAPPPGIGDIPGPWKPVVGGGW